MPKKDQETTGDREMTEMQIMLKVNDKINKLDRRIERLSGSLEATLPSLATSDQVKVCIADHKDHCSGARKKSRAGMVATIAGIITAITGATVAIVKTFGN